MASGRNNVSLQGWLSIVVLTVVLAAFSLSASAGERQDRGQVVAPAAAVNAITALGRGGAGADIDVRQTAALLLAKADRMGRVRVIVKVRLPEQAELGRAMADGAQEAGRRNGISRAQRDVLTRLGITPDADASGRPQAPATLPDNIANLRLFRTAPYLSMFADASTLERLLADPQVVAVHADVPVPPALKESVPLINADDVWGKGSTGSGIAVAILDTGVDKSHAFFQSRVVSEACYSTTYAPHGATSLCPGGVEESTAAGSGVDCSGAAGCGHGSHVAGIAAGADAVDGVDIYSGVAKGADIIAIQVFSQFTGGYCDGAGGDPCVLTYNTDQMAALDHLYDNLSGTHDIAAVNMSLGGGYNNAACDEDARKAYIDNLRSVGIITVIAAGNDYYDDGVGAPGCISTAVTVAASTKLDQLSAYTNWGELIDVIAPGSSIRSAQSAGTYVTMSGTSMAAPHVAGAFALLKDAYPTASVVQLETAMATSDVAIAWDGVTKKRIDMDKATAYLRDLVLGSLRVTIGPAGATSAGAQWRRVGTSTWLYSGATEGDIAAGSYAVEFKAIPGWTTPENRDVTISGGALTSFSATYVLQTGSIQVNILPQGAIDAGAKWRRTGTVTWYDSGATEGNVPAGNYMLEFGSVSGWNTPAQQLVTVVSGTTTVASVTYSAVTSSGGGGGGGILNWLALALLGVSLMTRRMA